DPAPLSMAETVVTLKPPSQWRTVDTWYSAWTPQWIRPLFRHITPDHISQEELVDQMNQALQLPGVSNAWTMPIKNRIDTLPARVATPGAVKVSGAAIDATERLGPEIEAPLAPAAGPRSVFAERTGGGYFPDVDWDRRKLARYGLAIEDAQAVVMSAIGG